MGNKQDRTFLLRSQLDLQGYLGDHLRIPSTNSFQISISRAQRKIEFSFSKLKKSDASALYPKRIIRAIGNSSPRRSRGQQSPSYVQADISPPTKTRDKDDTVKSRSSRVEDSFKNMITATIRTYSIWAPGGSQTILQPYPVARRPAMAWICLTMRL